MKIYSVFEPEFRDYGQVLEGYDFSMLFSAAKARIVLPEQGFDYCASLPELEALPESARLQARAFGGLPIQIGCCYGRNNTLNCLEYHKSSELNIALDPVILLLGMQTQMENWHLKTDTVRAFAVPAGVGVELYATTLHYAPCSTTPDGYRVLCVLPRGTNGPAPSGLSTTGEDLLCRGANKWLIAHPHAPEARQDAFTGLDGENITVETKGEMNMEGKKVYIGNDTAGFYLKSKCIEYLEGKHIPYVDCGSEDDPDIEATRYPFFAARVAKAVASGEARCGLLICGTGIGISMAANKFKGIRAGLCSTTYDAVMTRRHNNANILCMGGKTTGEWLAIEMLEAFLNTEYDGGFHDGSLELIEEMERSMMNDTVWAEEPRKISTGALADAELFDRNKG